MSFPWVKLVQQATECHHIREIFYKCYPFINEPAVHNEIFERINFIRKESVDAQQVRDLDDLIEDIELEMEFGTMLKAQAAKAKKEESKPEGSFFSAVEAKEEYQKIKIDGLLKDDGDLSSKRGLWAKVERELTLKVLDDCKGNRTQAARALGISVRTLRNKLNFYVRAAQSFPEKFPDSKATLLDFTTGEEIPKH